jgi:hypothetical protein
VRFFPEFLVLKLQVSVLQVTIHSKVIIVQIFVRIPYNESSPNLILYIRHELTNIRVKRVYNQQIAVLKQATLLLVLVIVREYRYLPTYTALFYSVAVCTL